MADDEVETDDRPITGKNPDGINGQYRKKQAAWERFSPAPSGDIATLGLRGGTASGTLVVGSSAARRLRKVQG